MRKSLTDLNGHTVSEAISPTAEHIGLSSQNPTSSRKLPALLQEIWQSSSVESMTSSTSSTEEKKRRSKKKSAKRKRRRYSTTINKTKPKKDTAAPFTPGTPATKQTPTIRASDWEEEPEPPGTKCMRFLCGGPVCDLSSGSTDFRTDFHRNTWPLSVDYPVVLIAVTVGLGNVLHFPASAYRNGGGAFLMCYSLLTVFIGMPLFYMECCLGRFCSRGGMSCWQLAPLFKGLGLTIGVTSGILGVKYAVDVSVAFFYFFNSFIHPLPWTKCTNNYNSKACVPVLDNLLLAACAGNATRLNGSCHEASGKYLGIVNMSLYRSFTNKTARQSSLEFWEHMISGGVKVGELRLTDWQPDMIVCLFCVWVSTFIIRMAGLKSLGKVSLFVLLILFCVTTVLIISAASASVSTESIVYYFTPQFDHFMKPELWFNAMTDVLFSLSIGYGFNITLSSYCKFKCGDPFKLALLVVITETLASFVFGIITFMYIGNMAQYLKVPINKVFTEQESSGQLVYVLYPQIVPTNSETAYQSTIFFLALILTGLSSQIVHVEVLLSGILDIWPITYNRQQHINFTLCLMGFLASLPLAKKGGVSVVSALWSVFVEFNLFLNGLLEVLVISWVYGVNNFSTDVQCLFVKRRPSWFMRSAWMFWIPFSLFAMMMWSFVHVQGKQRFKAEVEAARWFISLIPVSFVVLGMAHEVLKNRSPSETLFETATRLTKPSARWGPGDPRRRKTFYRHRLSSEIEALFNEQIHKWPLRVSRLPNLDVVPEVSERTVDTIIQRASRPNSNNMLVSRVQSTFTTKIDCISLTPQSLDSPSASTMESSAADLPGAVNSER